ncbi:putative abieta-7,13-dien-18-ol hydroxylase [Lupinus albus]|uniref:Putative abieta-7,13-dien-18-ol hydroxylase n=1 Tax=Lupinus albus TaxID=3870 RepID=A0A6A4PIK7_LUPAL|nr:putative abieta-7,13-dien-18-ol hydroxylase [Lupinus albus]
MIWIATLLVSLTCLILCRCRKKKKLPPGPKGLPILGSLHKLGENPHRDLHQLSQKHGPIMYLRLGVVPTIVVSSPQAAEQFLKTHDLVFANRPPLEAAKYISWDQRNLSFADYGPYWRNMRKMCTLELLSHTKIDSFRSMSCRMVLGRKYMDKDLDDKGFKAVMKEAMHLAGTPNIGDYIPFVGALDLHGLKRRMKVVGKIFDDFFEKVFYEHMQLENKEDKIEDFVDVMLGFVGSKQSEYHIERPNIKAILLDMLAGSMETSAAAIEWTISELMKHPRVMKKLQMELGSVVGMKRKVDESDLDKLEYLNMVTKESLRLHPVAPLLVPHQSMEDCISMHGQL